MRLAPETRRRIVLPLLAGALLAGYLFAFVPLDRRAASLEAPLNQSWRKLANALGRTNAVKLDFTSITNQLTASRAALAAFEAAQTEARARVELDPTLRAELGAPFQLVDYENESGRVIGALTRLAKSQHVALAPGVFDGFPDQTADMKEPALLWAELAIIDGLLTTAINAGVTTIHSVTVPAPLTNGLRLLVELPVNLELTGPVASVGKFLQTVPLRADEIKNAALPATSTNKPALFFDRLVLRKQSPAKPDEVRLTVRVVGFIFRE